MAQDFYPFVDNGKPGEADVNEVRHPARIAVYDDAAAAPRVVVVEPKDVRAYLEEITLQVTQLAQGQGGTIPFMVIREIVENFIHAYFMEPTISILDHGNTIRFSDQGPGIAQKERALQYGTTSATEEMRRYIRGVGSGLPYAQQYMVDKGGSLRIDDNIAGGTVVTISTKPATPEQASGQAMAPAGQGSLATQPPQQGWGQPAWQGGYAQPWPQQAQPWQQGAQQGWGQPGWPQQTPQQPVWDQQWSVQPAQQPTQQQWPQVPAAQQAAMPAPAASAAPSPAWPTLTARARAILDYLASHDSVGPSDLSRAYGESQPTWTRELQSLEEAGLIRKEGQKRRLTAMGKSFLAN